MSMCSKMGATAMYCEAMLVAAQWREMQPRKLSGCELWPATAAAAAAAATAVTLSHELSVCRVGYDLQQLLEYA